MINRNYDHRKLNFAMLLFPLYFQGYEDQWKKLKGKNMVKIIIHGIENLTLVCPLFYLCGRVAERHRFLQSNIGPVPLEEEAMSRVLWLTVCSGLLIPISMLIQYALIHVYNSYGHPWSRFFNEFSSTEQHDGQYGFVEDEDKEESDDIFLKEELLDSEETV